MTDEPVESEPTPGDDLVRRARADRTAFGELFERYYPRVLRYCLRRLGDRTLAEDVTSEVFLNVARSIRELKRETETDFRRWLYRIATNAVLAHARRSSRRREHDAAVAEARSGATGLQTSHELLDWPTIHEAILALDERDQTIVTLRFFADCSHEEIADIVGATPGAVRTALSRTLARLRKQFDGATPRPHDSSPHN